MTKLAQQNQWHTESAKAESAAAYLRPVCGHFGIGQLKSMNPSIDPSPPGS